MKNSVAKIKKELISTFKKLKGNGFDVLSFERRSSKGPESTINTFSIQCLDADELLLVHTINKRKEEEIKPKGGR